MKWTAPKQSSWGLIYGRPNDALPETPQQQIERARQEHYKQLEARLKAERILLERKYQQNGPAERSKAATRRAKDILARLARKGF